MNVENGKPMRVRPASELDERRTWAKVDITYPDGTQESMECAMLRGFIIKKNDPNRLMAIATGFSPPGTDEAMVQLFPMIIPSLRVLKGDENGTDTDTETE